MKFSVIYSVESAPEEARYCLPRNWRTRWELTESRPSELIPGWVHFKLCALLDKDEFETFLDDTGLEAEAVETMGSIGAPGFGYGWAPAICFETYDPDFALTAYVTPIPEPVKWPEGKPFDERVWERVRAVILRKYGRESGLTCARR